MKPSRHLWICFVFLAWTAPILLVHAVAATQTLTWVSPAPDTVLRLDQPQPLSATASSGLSVSFRVLAGPAVIANGMITATNVGRVTLEAEQAGMADWAPVSERRQFNRGTLSFEPLGQLSFGTDAIAVRVVGDIAYVSAGGGLKTVDVRNPASPQLLGETAVGAFEIQVKDSLAYVATGNGLDILDLQDPARPNLLASFPVQGAEVRRVQVSGNLAHLACGYGGWRILDVSDPLQPRQLAEVSEPAWWVSDVEASDGTAYVASRWNLCRTYEFSALTVPVHAGSLGLSHPLELVRRGSLLYAAGNGRLEVWSLSGTAGAVQLGATTYFEDWLPLLFGIHLAQAGGFAYVANLGNGLRVLDVGDPYRPVDLGSHPPVGGAAIHVEGNLLYLASYSRGLQIYRQRESIPQSMEFSPPAVVSLTDPPPTLAAHASSGLPVSLTVVSGPAYLEGNTLIATGPGLVTVAAEQPGDEQFLPTRTLRSIAFAQTGAPLGWVVDPTFQLDPKVNGLITSLAVLPDGSVIAGGSTLWVQDRIQGRGFGEVVRLSTEGELDMSFPSWNEAHAASQGISAFSQVLTSSSGELIAVGQNGPLGNWSGGRDYISWIYRMSQDEPAWHLAATAGHRVKVFADRQGGWLLVGGNYEVIPDTAGSFFMFHLSRLAADGSVDPRFGIPPGMSDRSGYLAALDHVLPLANGGAVFAGATPWLFQRYNYEPNTPVFRLAADGQVVWRQTHESRNWLVPAKFAAHAANGRLVLFPSREVLDVETGRRLGTFPVPTNVVAATTTFFQEPDGRLILSGTFTNYAGIPRRGLAAVLPDGSLDLSLDPGLGTTNAFTAIARQADGSLLLAGPAGTFDGVSHRGLIRLIQRNPDYVPPTQPMFYVQGPAGPVFECGYPGEIQVIRTGVLTHTNRVLVQSLAETATPGADFVGVNEELVFLPGEGVKSVPLLVLRDDLAEGNETLRILTTFEPDVAVTGPTNLTVQISSVDCGVAFITNAITLKETTGASDLLALATEYPPPGFTTRLRLRDLTAQAARDYIPWEGSVLVSRQFPLRLIDNPWPDGDRQFVVEAYDPANGETVTPERSLVVTIADDDTLAGPARGLAGNLHNLVPMRDGWLLLGDFPTADGWARPGLARYTLAGDLDHAFAPPLELTGLTECASGMPDGGALLGGRFDRVGTWPAGGLVRLLADGSLDEAFALQLPFPGTNCPSAANHIRTILAAADGSAWVAGSFPALFACDPSPRVLRISAAGLVLAEWSIPGHAAESTFAFVGNGRDARFLQGSSGVFAVEEGGLRLLEQVKLFVGSPLVVLPDGALVGLTLGSFGVINTPLVRYHPDGTLAAQVTHFQAEGDVWVGGQIHALSVRADGQVLLSGLFRSTTKPPNTFMEMTLSLAPSELVSGLTVIGEPVNTLRLVHLVAHPSGFVAALNQLDYLQTEPKWLRLDEQGRPVADLGVRRVVLGDDQRVHLALRGQAPDGYTVEVSDDLDTWTEWFTSPEVNWGHSFMTPPLPVESVGRFYRLVLP